MLFHKGCTVEPLEQRTLLAAPWGQIPDLIDQDVAVQRFRKTTGKGHSVAIIDTGVNYNHPALGGGWGRRVIGGYDFVNRDADPMDETGHGTGVAGVISSKSFAYGGRRYQGIAPGAKIVALRVEDNSGYVPNERIEEALQWVLTNRKRFSISAVNLSFGDGGYTQKVSFQPYSDELARLRKAGVFVAAASGNEGFSKAGINYPAADPNVISVGSVNGGDVISRFTSRSGILDLLAPGEDVPTPILDIVKHSNTFVAASGTSFSVPFVVGAALLIKQMNRNLGAGQVLRLLKEGSVPNRDGDRENPSTGLTYSRIDIDNSLSRAARTKLSARPRRNRADTAPRPIQPAPAPRLKGLASVFSFRPILQGRPLAHPFISPRRDLLDS